MSVFDHPELVDVVVVEALLRCGECLLAQVRAQT